MRTFLLAVAAMTLLAAGAGQAVFRWHAAPAASEHAPQPSALHSTLRRLAPVDKVEHEQLRQQLLRLTEGNVVLDMGALESIEAAEDLVLHWRSQHAVDAHLVCWVAAAEVDSAAAVRALSEAGCSVLHVALDAALDGVAEAAVVPAPATTSRTGRRARSSIAETKTARN